MKTYFDNQGGLVVEAETAEEDIALVLWMRCKERGCNATDVLGPSRFARLGLLTFRSYIPPSVED